MFQISALLMETDRRRLRMLRQRLATLELRDRLAPLGPHVHDVTHNDVTGIIMSSDDVTPDVMDLELLRDNLLYVFISMSSYVFPLSCCGFLYSHDCCIDMYMSADKG